LSQLWYLDKGQEIRQKVDCESGTHEWAEADMRKRVRGKQWPVIYQKGHEVPLSAQQKPA